MDTTNSETHLGPPPSHPPEPAGFPPGTILAGRDRILALAGRGGMGEVYRADDLRLGQPVALKFLPRALEADSVARERLLGEVRHARTVSHPNVCRVYDVGEVNGRCFLTMEYIDGEDLASLLRRIGRLPASKALEIARQLCAGLAAAHERRVLHRDLKPANVMIDGRGQARITDFGLAVEATPTDPVGPPGLSPVAADFAGTLAYTAPERFEGKPATVQSDLYALGLILYETYTGKPAVAPAHAIPVPQQGTGRAVLLDWQRAHSDSTPTKPSALVTEIEPAVERVILRCLEKDPARRPLSAAHVANMLPGGDPLSAAIAAGETPSPELVAASGEEGTLPRAQAWLCFAGCLAALALVLPLLAWVNLVNLVPFAAGPDALRLKAREMLQRLGHGEAPRDSAWWFAEDRPSRIALAQMSPASRRFQEAPATRPGPILFCYRQSPAGLTPYRAPSLVRANDPPPMYESDAYLELDPRGRLVFLRVGGLRSADEPAGAPEQAVAWSGLFDAAGLDERQFRRVEPRRSPPVFADARGAWSSAQDGQTLRVEAAMRRGRPVYFELQPPAGTATRPTGALAPTSTAALDVFILLSMLGSLAALAVLAKHNVRHGRGDRRGAVRLALFVFALQSLWLALERHWVFLSPLYVAIFGGGAAFFAALAAWLYYLGLEPFVRKRWPYLLIAWTRLVEGRWRDGLVGRSVLAGVAAGIALSGVLAGAVALGRQLNLDGAVPLYIGDSLNGLGWFLAASEFDVFVPPYHALVLLAVLLLARLVLRVHAAAWVALVVLVFIANWYEIVVPSGLVLAPSRGVATAVAALSAALAVGALRYGGLLTCAIALLVANALKYTPVTIDVTRWYVWRTAFVVALIAALACWGFTNVLGRQSMFPSGALDD